MSKWINLRRAVRKDEDDSEFELYLDMVPTTDGVEYTVWLQRLKLFGEKREDYSKNYGWFPKKEDADEWFDIVVEGDKRDAREGDGHFVEDRPTG